MKKQGFTIIEILAVLAIIGILIGGGLTISIQAIRNAEIRDAATQVATDFRRARSTAQRNSTNSVITWTAGASGASTYSVRGQTRNLPGGIRLSCATSCPGTPSLTYQAPYAELNLTNGVVFNVQRPGSGMIMQVRVVGVTGKVFLGSAP